MFVYKQENFSLEHVQTLFVLRVALGPESHNERRALPDYGQSSTGSEQILNY